MRAIVKMLRIPNLLIIAITLLLLRYMVFIPVYMNYLIVPGMENLQFLLMVVTTMIIAAAGYVSNDYFDVVTDRINKPQKLYIGNQFSQGTALATAVLLSLIAVILSFWLTWLLKNWLPSALLIVALFVAWWYAIRLKKSFLWGNIAVACMSAGTIVMAWLIEKQCLPLWDEVSGIINSIVTAISIFAFSLSLLREIVKDIEDIDGDKLINCRSMPIVMGIPFTKTILLIYTALTILLLIIAQVFLFRYSRVFAVIWVFICVEIPLLYFAFLLNKAHNKADFHRISTLLKFIMLGGIASIVAGQF
jgi:4-hydroxybenzoate polyprenyltransferase